MRIKSSMLPIRKIVMSLTSVGRSQGEAVELSTGQGIYYSNSNPLPVEDVAETLLALKAIIERTPDVLVELFPGLTIYGVQIHVSEVSTGSLWEELAVKFLWGNQEALESDVERLRDTLKVKQLLENKTLLSCIVIALVLGGGLYLLNKANAPEPQKAILQGNQNNVVIIGSKITEVEPSVLQGIIDSVVARNPAVATDAVKTVRPAKKEDNVSIRAGRNSDIAISPPAVKAMPSLVPEDDSEESIEDFASIELQIRAIDLDSTRRGWAAVLPTLSDKRTKLHLDPTIKPQELVGRMKVVGDVTVIFKYTDGGEKYPALVFLRRITP